MRHVKPTSIGERLQAGRDSRPGLAIICNSPTPYQVHLHRRIATEIPGFKLWTLYTHELSNAHWSVDVPAEISGVMFGSGESCADQDRLARMPREWRRGGEIIAFLQQHNVRFVVTMGYNDVGRLRIMRWCRRTGVACYLFGDSNIRGDNARGLKSQLKHAILSRIIRSCSGVLVCGSLGKAYFVKYGAKPNRIFHFPYEPDYDLIRMLTPEMIRTAASDFGLRANRRRIVYSGRMIAVKRVDLLISAFIQVADRRPWWDLVLIGDGPLRGALERSIPPALRARVTWTGFLDNQARMGAIYRNCDVLALPSDYEPWALVINEAAAAGLAIVASNVVGAAAELVRDHVNGRLFAKADLAGLVRAVLDVTDETKTQAMKAASNDVLAEWRGRGDPVEGLRQAVVASRVGDEASLSLTAQPGSGVADVVPSRVDRSVAERPQTSPADSGQLEVRIR